MAFLLLFLLMLTSPATAGFDAGSKAFSLGNYEKSFEEWQSAAEQGDPAAQRNIAHLYRWGKGAPQDLTQAAYWYFTAAKNGSASAMYNLGIMYLRGEGIPRNEEEGVIWLERAKENGYTKAEQKLAHLKTDLDLDFPAQEELLSPIKAVNRKKTTPMSTTIKEPPLYAHLASYYNLQTLEKGWAELQETYPELKGLKTLETQVTLPKKGKYIRLYIKGKAAEVRRICGKLNAKKQYCLISYP